MNIIIDITPVTNRILRMMQLLNHNTDPYLICKHNVKQKQK